MDYQNNVLFKTFLEKTLNGLVLKAAGSSFLIMAVGDEFLNMTGLKKESLIAKEIAEVPKGIFHSSVRQSLQGVLQHKQKVNMNTFLLKPVHNSKGIYVSISITPVFDELEKVSHLIYTVSDMDAITREAKDLVNRNYFMELIDQAPVGISILNGKELIVESANNVMLELWGKSESILNLPLAMALPELEGQSFLKLLNDVFTWGEPLVGNEAKVLLIRNSHLETAYFNFVYQPIKTKGGITTGVMVVAAEVTTLVTIKKQLEESVSNFKSVVMNAHYGLLVLKGKDWLVEIANQPLLDLWGKTKEEVMGLPLMKILPELLGQPFPEHLKRVGETGKSSVKNEELFYYNTPLGISKKYVSFFYDPMLDAEGTVYGIIVGAEDITARVENRLKIERAEEMLRIAVESANLGTWHYDPLTESLTVSPRFKELFGYMTDQDITYDSVIAQISEECRYKVLKAIKASVSNGAQFNVDFSIVGNFDKKMRWVSASGRIHRDQEGLPIRFSGILMDITEHKQDEIRKNDFIAMVSHELKTPLTSLKAYVQLLSTKAKQTGDIFTMNSLAKVEGQVNKMNNMIRSFLDLSRLEAGKIYLEKETFTMNTLIEEVVQEIYLTNKTHVILFSDCKSLAVYADREKIGQVLNNLLSNAIKYSPTGTTVKIQCDLVDGMVCVGIKDEGVGIAKNDLSKLFNRFYRVQNMQLKTVSGFGIGLYLSAEIIKRHHGNIWVESEENKGSIFYFSLPLQA